MRGKKLLILTAAAMLLVVIAVVTQKKDRAKVPTRTGEPVLPGLELNDVAKVVISTSGKTTTVSRAAGTWVSEDTYRYPIDFGKLRGALIELSELKIGQVVAQLTDEQRRNMKMLPPGVSDSDAGTMVELYAEGDKLLASMLLGSEHERQSAGANPMMGGGYPDGRYLSPDGGKSVYLVSETLGNISVEPREWLNTEIVNVEASDVDLVTIAHPGEEILVFNKSGNDLVLQGLAEDEEMNSSKNHTIKSGLGYLRFEEVARPDLTEAQLGLTNAVVYTVNTKKGERYEARIGGSPEGSDNRYLRLSVSLEEPEPEPEEDATTELTEEQIKTRDAEKVRKAKERKELQDKVAGMNQRLTGWTFVISKYKSDSLLLKRPDVVQEKKKPEPEEGDEEKEPDADGAAADEAAGDTVDKAAETAGDPAGKTPDDAAGGATGDAAAETADETTGDAAADPAGEDTAGEATE